MTFGIYAPKTGVVLTMLAAGAGLLACSSSEGPVAPEGSADKLAVEQALTDDADAVDTATFQHGTRAHAMPVRSGGPTAEAVKPALSGTLQYFGGPVLSNVKVVQVLYGSGTYLSNISGTSSPTLADFYTGVTSSAYFDWLTEYNTPTQTIGHGSFVSRVQITPAKSRNRTTISDTQIQAEINAQINAGALPAPDANTLYMVNFPKGKHISLSGTPSCQAGGFCAYHGTFVRNSSDVFYGVLPDMSAGSGCDVGCGGSTQFNNQTSVASHELIEAVTDAAVGLATVFGPPLAWYDEVDNGEIGDLCNGIQGTVATSTGTFTVQKEFDNATRSCIVSK